MLQGVKLLPALLLWGFFDNELEHDVCLSDSFSLIFLKLLYILQASSCPQQGLSSYSSGISQRNKLIALKKTNSVLTSLVLKSHLKRRGSASLVNIASDPSPGVRVRSDTHLAQLKEVLGSGCAFSAGWAPVSSWQCLVPPQRNRQVWDLWTALG